jgi:hypothetical protein
MRYRSPTMTPGAKRAPPIASELVSTEPELAGAPDRDPGRGVDGARGEGMLRREAEPGGDGGIVSADSKARSSPRIVSAEFGSPFCSTREPQAPQNRAPELNRPPHEVQNMRTRFYNGRSSRCMAQREPISRFPKKAQQLPKAPMKMTMLM